MERTFDARHSIKSLSPRTIAVLGMLLATFLWSTSWVFIKVGLQDLPALTFAGLRYTLAFACLLPFLLRPANRSAVAALTRNDWARLAALGLAFYAVTQGAQFVSLALLPAVTVNILLNVTAVLVALSGMALLSERPRSIQWAGILVNLLGVGVYFYPLTLLAGQALGLVVAIVGVLANVASALLGRHVNRTGSISPLVVTGASMGIGALVLLAVGLLAQGLPQLSLFHWGLIAWLAVVNTAFAFTLWNWALRHLSAVEASILNSTMLVQIALLAWFFLGEEITWQEGIGLGLAGLGVLLVQWRSAERRPTKGESED